MIFRENIFWSTKHYLDIIACWNGVAYMVPIGIIWSYNLIADEE